MRTPSTQARAPTPFAAGLRCNVHARRYFVKALEANDARAAVPLAAFKTLYGVEADAKQASVEERRAAAPGDALGRGRYPRPVVEPLAVASSTPPGVGAPVDAC
jgi:hypothetical protein